MAITIDLSGLREMTEAHRAKITAATRPAAQAGAQVIYDEARRLAPVSDRSHYFYGTASRDAPKGQKKAKAYGPYAPGSLRDAIYQAFSKNNSTAHRAVYHVSWNQKKAPYAWMVELGTSRAAAHPFLRPAILAKSDAAAAAMKAKFIEAMQ